MLLIRVNNHVTNMPLIKPALLKFKNKGFIVSVNKMITNKQKLHFL